MTRHTYSPQEISTLVSALTDRDRAIIMLLGDHGVLTTNQIASAYFTSIKRAQARLLTLFRLKVLARFRNRPRYGSVQWHWCLEHVGARVHAAARGQKPPRPGVVADRLLSYAVNPQLPHRLGCNDFFIRILSATRGKPDRGLAAWDNEGSASQLAGARMRPDAAATYIEAGNRIAFWFEHDRGTEPLSTLEGKLDGYRAVLRVGAPRPVLIELPSAAREAHLHEHLQSRVYPFVIATTTVDISGDPTAEVWRPVSGYGRCRLVQLSPRQLQP